MRHFLFASDDSSSNIFLFRQRKVKGILASGYGKASDHQSLIPLRNIEYWKTLDPSYIRQTLRYVRSINYPRSRHDAE